MAGLRATRSSTGEIVELGLDDDGRLSARTPDGTVLQSQTIKASRLKLDGDQLTWSGVQYDVDDPSDAGRFVDSITPAANQRRRWVALTLVLLLGVGLGIVGVAVARQFVATSNCDEARQIIDDSVAKMEQINEAEVQDRSFFAAVIVEQRTITYTMGSEPSCFSLTERAAAEGLLAGISGLLETAPG